MKTLAIVIGNDEYHESAKLTNAVNDARAMKEAFKKLEYDIIYKENCNNNDAIEVLEQFSEKIIDYDASIFYFAGHGFEMNGENFLTTVECQIPPANEFACSRASIALKEVLDICKKNTNKVNIIIIDACRKNLERGVNNGLKPASAPQGTLIAFSTSPNEGASDTITSSNSIYTGALVNFIERENLSVEKLFKKVRKRVYIESEGKQTTWEHTSLINDFYFNAGQAIHSVEIPYKNEVVKDIYYKDDNDFGELINELKSYNWYKQNPAIDKLLQTNAKLLDKNQQFILGRNLLQCADGGAASACRFFENIDSNLAKYNKSGENHLLNGIFYEIYFDPYGQFRKKKKNTYYIENILSLRKISLFNNSFKFIRNLILNEDYGLTYIPSSKDNFINIYINAFEKEEITFSGDLKKYQKINTINYEETDIKFEIGKYSGLYFTKKKLLNTIKNIFIAPINLIKIHCNVSLTRATFNN